MMLRFTFLVGALSTIITLVESQQGSSSKDNVTVVLTPDVFSSATGRNLTVTVNISYSGSFYTPSLVGYYVLTEVDPGKRRLEANLSQIIARMFDENFYCSSSGPQPLQPPGDGHYAFQMDISRCLTNNDEIQFKAMVTDSTSKHRVDVASVTVEDVVGTVGVQINNEVVECGKELEIKNNVPTLNITCVYQGFHPQPQNVTLLHKNAHLKVTGRNDTRDTSTCLFNGSHTPASVRTGATVYQNVTCNVSGATCRVTLRLENITLHNKSASANLSEYYEICDKVVSKLILPYSVDRVKMLGCTFENENITLTSVNSTGARQVYNMNFILEKDGTAVCSAQVKGEQQAEPQRVLERGIQIGYQPKSKPRIEVVPSDERASGVYLTCDSTGVQGKPDNYTYTWHLPDNNITSHQQLLAKEYGNYHCEVNNIFGSSGLSKAYHYKVEAKDNTVLYVLIPLPVLAIAAVLLYAVWRYRRQRAGRVPVEVEDNTVLYVLLPLAVLANAAILLLYAVWQYIRQQAGRVPVEANDNTVRYVLLTLAVLANAAVLLLYAVWQYRRHRAGGVYYGPKRAEIRGRVSSNKQFVKLADLHQYVTSQETTQSSHPDIKCALDIFNYFFPDDYGKVHTHKFWITCGKLNNLNEEVEAQDISDSDPNKNTEFVIHVYVNKSSDSEKLAFLNVWKQRNTESEDLTHVPIIMHDAEMDKKQKHWEEASSDSCIEKLKDSIVKYQNAIRQLVVRPDALSLCCYNDDILVYFEDGCIRRLTTLQSLLNDKQLPINWTSLPIPRIWSHFKERVDYVFSTCTKTNDNDKLDSTETYSVTKEGEIFGFIHSTRKWELHSTKPPCVLAAKDMDSNQWSIISGKQIDKFQKSMNVRFFLGASNVPQISGCTSCCNMRKRHRKIKLKYKSINSLTMSNENNENNYDNCSSMVLEGHWLHNFSDAKAKKNCFSYCKLFDMKHHAAHSVYNLDEKKWYTVNPLFLEQFQVQHVKYRAQDSENGESAELLETHSSVREIFVYDSHLWVITDKHMYVLEYDEWIQHNEIPSFRCDCDPSKEVRRYAVLCRRLFSWCPCMAKSSTYMYNIEHKQWHTVWDFLDLRLAEKTERASALLYPTGSGELQDLDRLASETLAYCDTESQAAGISIWLLDKSSLEWVLHSEQKIGPHKLCAIGNSEVLVKETNTKTYSLLCFRYPKLENSNDGFVYDRIESPSWGEKGEHSDISFTIDGSTIFLFAGETLYKCERKKYDLWKWKELTVQAYTLYKPVIAVGEPGVVIVGRRHIRADTSEQNDMYVVTLNGDTIPLDCEIEGDCTSDNSNAVFFGEHLFVFTLSAVYRYKHDTLECENISYTNQAIKEIKGLVIRDKLFMCCTTKGNDNSDKLSISVLEDTGTAPDITPSWKPLYQDSFCSSHSSASKYFAFK